MNPQLVILTASFLFVFTACNNQQSANTEQTQNNEVSQSEQMKQAYQGVLVAFATGNTDDLGNYVAENAINHADVPPGITSTGLQQLKDVIAMYQSSFSNVKMNVHHLAADGDFLFAHGSWSAINTGDFMGMPATGKSVSNIQFVDMLRFENGKFAEHWEVSDNLGFMTQMDVIPQEGEAPPAVSLPLYDWNATSTEDAAKAAQMKEAYKAVVNMIQSGDLTNLEQYLAADMKEHSPIPGVEIADGIEGARQTMTLFKQIYPDLKISIERMAAEGNILIAQINIEGTYAGGFPGIPQEAAGKKINVKGVDIVKFNAEGKGSEHWEVTDHYTEMVQLGLIPDQSAESAAAAN